MSNKMEAYVASLLIIRGASDGGSLIDHLLSAIAEQEEAKQAVYALARALSRMGEDGTVTCKVDKKDGSHTWALNEEQKRLWCTERLNVEDAETH